ncbi:hypothetical protein ACQP1K_21990 [Sphaerimonospora sp. CA-214678]|uniref:hypothetical protein n=1 Tax=Sphaerimonospora sp. CA-214678 TaxID=3240029 RepID=UPI003D91E264
MSSAMTATTGADVTVTPAPATGPIVLGIASGASALAGLAHYAAIPAHRAEWPAAALLFTVVGAFQVLWPVLVRVHPRRALWWTALAVNVGLLALWTLSRTTGMPFGPEAGEPEHIGVLDTIASASELIVVAALLVRPHLLSRATRPAESPAD